MKELCSTISALLMLAALWFFWSPKTLGESAAAVVHGFYEAKP